MNSFEDIHAWQIHAETEAAGYYEERHASGKYITCLCSKCMALVGMREGERWMLKLDKCKNGHAIEWEWKTIKPDEHHTCQSCRHCLTTTYPPSCGCHANYEVHESGYQRQKIITLHDTCEHWEELIEIVKQPQTFSKGIEEHGEQLTMDIF